jgi:hypothetical protein
MIARRISGFTPNRLSIFPARPAVEMNVGLFSSIPVGPNDA